MEEPLLDQVWLVGENKKETTVSTAVFSTAIGAGLHLWVRIPCCVSPIMLENTGVAIKMRVFPRPQIINYWGRKD